tara:strand:- start:232 stop:456 length:225 start_codon:yes stop_codon:yes gene_type:complete
MDSDREELYQVKMALAIKLSKDTIYGDAIKCIVDDYNKYKDDRHMKSINAIMKVLTGTSHWSCCGINQHGVWVK